MGEQIIGGVGGSNCTATNRLTPTLEGHASQALKQYDPDCLLDRQPTSLEMTESSPGIFTFGGRNTAQVAALAGLTVPQWPGR
jgi:hypothetical protein